MQNQAIHPPTATRPPPIQRRERVRAARASEVRYTVRPGAVPKWEGRGLQNLHSWVRFPPAPPLQTLPMSNFTALEIEIMGVHYLVARFFLHGLISVSLAFQNLSYDLSCGF